MSQKTVTNLDKAAVLLNRLDPKALDKVLELLGPEFSGKLRPVISAVSRRTDLGSLTDQVLEEFRELQRDVRATIADMPAFHQQLPTVPRTEHSTSDAHKPGHVATALADSAMPSPDTGSTGPAERNAVPEVDPNDPATSLAKVPAGVLGAALRPESARIIATVLRQLPSEFGGKVLESLPAEKRQTVFVMLADKNQLNPGVVRSVLTKIAHVCQTIDPSTVEQQDRRLKTLVGILQNVEREERIRLMETLTEHDPELATQIDDSMYDYADVMRIEDRSIQKLLSQLEQKVVAIALKAAPEDLRQKVMKNLSERVRAALNEEMELLSAVSASKAEQARREIANAIRGMDKEGVLVWTE